MAPSKQSQMSAETAELLAVEALSFIAQDGERLGRFLAISGIGPAQIREAAQERYFLAGVLDYVAADEGLLLAVARHAAVDPTAITRARTVLGTSPGQSDAR